MSIITRSRKKDLISKAMKLNNTPKFVEEEIDDKGNLNPNTKNNFGYRQKK